MIDSKEATVVAKNTYTKPARSETSGCGPVQTCCGPETSDERTAADGNEACGKRSNHAVENFLLTVTPTKQSCPIGETTGKRNIAQGKIPVLACEGGCIRGEIAGLTVNILVREEEYARSCHGELLTVPDSAIAKWTREADKVVLIDGCFLHCHERLLRDLIGNDRLVVFDALSHYNKYTDIFDIEAVPEDERKQTARETADWILEELGKEKLSAAETVCK